jgi:predicted type IV restriction endonuclease
MTLEHTLSDITQHLDDWQGINEAQTAQAIVLRILHALGYDIWNPFEVMPEASGNGGYRPDYTVQIHDDIRIVIEVKLLGKNLADTEKDMTQAVNYINSLGKRWAILTNGQEWRFLDNDIRGDISQKHELTIDLKRHAKHAAGYLERLLSKKHWQTKNAEDDLKTIIQDIRADIQKRLQLGKIANKLTDKIGKGFSKDKLGIEMAVQYVLDANERQLAEDNLEHLVKRLLNDEETEPIDTVVNQEQEDETETPSTETLSVESVPTQSQTSLSEVERAIVEGIVRSRAFTSERGGADVQAWLGDEPLEATSWRDIHAGLAEAMLALEDKAVEELTQIYGSVTEKRKGDGTTYPPSGYRQLSNGRFIFLHAGASTHQRKILGLLTHLNITSQRLKVTYRGETFYLP